MRIDFGFHFLSTGNLSDIIIYLNSDRANPLGNKKKGCKRETCEIFSDRKVKLTFNVSYTNLSILLAQNTWTKQFN